MKRFYIILLTALTSIAGYTQQDPVYTLNMNNPFTLNPAYAGYSNLLNAQVSHRIQWVGLAGNPVTTNFSGHMSVRKDKLGVGLQVIRDVIGENKNSELQAALAYKLKLSTATLSFGMQAGFINFSNHPDELTIRHSGDPNFVPYSEIRFNTGAGIFLTGEQYALGLSAPRLLPATISLEGQSIELYQQTFYLSGAYLFLMSDKIRFNPSVMLRSTQGLPLSADALASFLWLDQFSAGVFTRNLNTYGMLVSLKYKDFIFGYTFEVPSNQSVGARFTSHEIMVGLRKGIFSFHDRQVIRNF